MSDDPIAVPDRFRVSMRKAEFAAVVVVCLGAFFMPTSRGSQGSSVQSEDMVGASSRIEDTGSRIISSAAEPENWLSHGRDYQETRHSPLLQIKSANVPQLGLVWSYDLDTNRGQESTPLVVDGVMFTTSAWSKVQAFDAVSGRLLWQFDPKVPGAAAANACCDVVNRGAAYWNGKVFVGTIDGRLIAIDAKSGRTVWSTVTVDQSKGYTITGAPRVVKGRVIIGNGGAEYDVRGYVSAYDADTGKLDWRFYTVPGQPGRADGAASDSIMAKIAATWSADTWTRTGGGGGGTVWDSMAYDPKLDLLYIGVGNAGYYARELRSPKQSGNNDNLFVGSVLALRPDTGGYVWHYQETPGDQWDYTSTQHMILADLPIAGTLRKVLLHAPKNGFFYVLDRQTGELLSAEAYGKMNWASGVDMKTGRPIMNPDADYSRTGKVWSGLPGSAGAHDWQPMAFNPATGLVYIPALEAGMSYMLDRGFKPLAKGMNVGIDVSVLNLPDDPRALAGIRHAMKGFLLAWDPVSQREAWRVPLRSSWNGGVLSTAGNLVFQGDEEGGFSAFDAASGTRLWTFDAQSAISAAPISWAKAGRQYITVVAGWGGSAGLAFGPLSWSDAGPRLNKSRVLTFALGGKAKLPPITAPVARKLQPPRQFADAQTIETGRVVYHRTCYVCHGLSGVSAGIAPDLRYSTALSDGIAWFRIVGDGALSEQGMVGFKENFSAAQIESLRAYLINRADSAVLGTTHVE